MAKKPYNSVEELLDEAQKRLADIAEDGIKQTNWDDLEFMTDVRIADFVEQRFTGMNENFIQMEHDINAAERRLENMEESPRKKAAKTILDLYRQSYLEATELAYLSKVYSEAQMMTITEPYKDRVSRDIASQRNRLDSANMRKYLAKTEELSIFQNLMGTFFMDNAIMRQTEEGQIDAAREKAQNDVLKSVGEKLPAEPEYVIYRAMEGYTEKRAEVLTPKAANLIMNSNVLTDVTVDNFPARIRKENPKRLDIEWGVSTFDNMMDALYNKDELKAIKKDKKNFLDTVFLDGRPALSVLPKQRKGESRDDYMRRMKCEVVAYALEGKARMDVAPFAKTNEGYDFKDPIPMHVQVNLKEEVSVWRRFKNFLGIKPKETKKQMAERISLDELGKEDRHDEIKAYVRSVVERERDHHRMKTAIKRTSDACLQADMDFFGFMIEGKTPEKDQTLIGLLDNTVSTVAMVPMDKETAAELGIPEKECSGGTVSMMKTLYRSQTRTALCRLFAMTQGMSMEEVLSDDPELRARKQEIGKAFVEKVTVMSKDEFIKKNGKDADYHAYFRERQNDICDTLGTMMVLVGEHPMDFFRDPSITQLAADYQKADFIIGVTQDLFQCCPPHVKNQNYDEMEGLEQTVRCIGEMQHVKNYCEKFVATESFLEPVFDGSEKARVVTEGAAERIAMEHLMEKCRDVRSLKEMKDITNESWAKSVLMLRASVYTNAWSNPEFFAMCGRYAQSGQHPIAVFVPETKEYSVGTPEVISGLMKAQRTGNMKELMSFEEISMYDIQTSRRKHMTPKELAKEQKVLEKQAKEQRKLK